MSPIMRRIILSVVLLVILYVGSSLVGTATQLAAAADRFYPGAGQLVFFALLGGLGLLLIYPLFVYFRLPPALIPPNDSSGDAYDRYQKQLLAHLNRIRNTQGLPPVGANEIHVELERLAGEANRTIQSTASSVFVSTAVMQNGRLDGLIVLGVQLRLIWKIAEIYRLRPSPRQIAYLYGNVGLSVITAQGMDDIDFAELSAPIVTAIIPSLKGAIPGMQGFASLLVNSLSSGTANAMLTLRVGSIAQQYCCPLQSETANSSIRSNATKFALKNIGPIVKDVGAKIAAAGFDTVTSTIADIAGRTKDVVQNAVTNVADGLSGIGNKTSDSVKSVVEGAKTTLARSVDAASGMISKPKSVSESETSPEPKPVR